MQVRDSFYLLSGFDLVGWTLSQDSSTGEVIYSHVLCPRLREREVLKTIFAAHVTHVDWSKSSFGSNACFFFLSRTEDLTYWILCSLAELMAGSYLFPVTWEFIDRTTPFVSYNKTLALIRTWSWFLKQLIGANVCSWRDRERIFGTELLCRPRWVIPRFILSWGRAEPRRIAVRCHVLIGSVVRLIPRGVKLNKSVAFSSAELVTSTASPLTWGTTWRTSVQSSRSSSWSQRMGDGKEEGRRGRWGKISGTWWCYADGTVLVLVI